MVSDINGFLMEKCNVSKNESPLYGSALIINGVDGVSIEDSNFYSNINGAIYIKDTPAILFRRNHISNNSGLVGTVQSLGIETTVDHFLIYNSTFEYNSHGRKHT